VVLSLIAAVHAQFQYTVQLASNYRISWNISSSDITIQLQTKTQNWIGFGLSPVIEASLHGMAMADIVVCVFNSSTVVTIEDRFRNNLTPGAPETDVSLGGFDNLYNEFGMQNSAGSVAQFSRKLKTGDQFDYDYGQDALVDVIFAWGKSNVFGWHGAPNTGMAKLNFVTGASVVFNY